MEIAPGQIPVAGDWPYLGTREQVAAAKLVCEGLLERGLDKKSKEYKSAFMQLVRLLRSKRGNGKRRSPAVIRADQAWRMRKAAARAERATKQFQQLAERTDVAGLMQSIVDLMTQYGPAILEDRLKAKDYRAFRDCASLVDKLLARQESRQPQARPKRQVLVREWPGEGAKS